MEVWRQSATRRQFVEVGKRVCGKLMVTTELRPFGGQTLFQRESVTGGAEDPFTPLAAFALQIRIGPTEVPRDLFASAIDPPVLTSPPAPRSGALCHVSVGASRPRSSAPPVIPQSVVLFSISFVRRSYEPGRSLMGSPVRVKERLRNPSSQRFILLENNCTKYQQQITRSG